MICRGSKNIFNSTLFMAAWVACLTFILSTYPMVAAQAASFTEDFSAEEYVSPKDAVMIIRFNQPNVYFQDSLKKMVSTVSNIKPDAAYDIQSVIPSNREDIGDKYKNYNQNLRLVMAELNSLGIPIERVKIDIVDSASVNNHEIRIFIR